MNKITRYARIAAATLLFAYRLVILTARQIALCIAIPFVWLAMKICKFLKI